MINSIDESGRPGRAIVPGKKTWLSQRMSLSLALTTRHSMFTTAFPAVYHITCLSHAFRRTGDLVQVWYLSQFWPGQHESLSELSNPLWWGKKPMSTGSNRLANHGSFATTALIDVLRKIGFSCGLMVSFSLWSLAVGWKACLLVMRGYECTCWAETNPLGV